ncbi:hypothetical protein PLICRDRAFT_170051 [Plicaturopsis crispa FD-325 SS-3]|nr:hypothetical protein PLICRDRAFT_170051 [Plicaturopsis crispa FD-325 SS-3]
MPPLPSLEYLDQGLRWILKPQTGWPPAERPRQREHQRSAYGFQSRRLGASIKMVRALD